MNISNIYDNLKKSNFYSIVNDTCHTINNKQTHQCSSRYTKIARATLGDFIIIHTPCRIGRNLSCMREYCNQESDPCPICFFANKANLSKCTSLSKMNIIKIITPFILMPNAFPYLDNQFLITIPTHRTQYTIINKYSSILFTVFKELLTINPLGTIFFNGMCGNSLEHFHCQITTTIFPIFNHLPKKDGIINHNNFRGYLKRFRSKIEFKKFIKLLSHHNYNFILRKRENIIECVFFIRNCNVDVMTKNLKYGSTELAGIIAYSGSTAPDMADIVLYLNETNNLSNYTFLKDRSSKKSNTVKKKKHKKRKGGTLFRKSRRI